jgi:mono/diheme cytochrome c family protein
MKIRTLSALLPVLAAIHTAEAEEQTNSATIRAGRNIAVTSCIACHVVSPGQTVQPVLGPGIPSFQEIANRPDTTAEGLQGAMKIARWHNDALPSTLLPMSRLSDTERAQVVAYILTLRDSR